MSNDPNTYRSPVRTIGNVEDDAATNSTDGWSIPSLLKGIYHLLSGTLTVSFSTSGIATAAKQDTGNASVASIDTKATAANSSLASMDSKLTSLNFNTDTLEIALGTTTETAPATDTALSGLNGRMQRMSQRLTSLIALFPSSIGAKAAAGSLSVTTATDDNTLALLGAVNETPPATDTASSGHSGRLQRIAQRLTSIIALLPAALGQTTKAGSLSVSIASDDDLQAKLGIVTETAPATDTASSGLNGRLQRIAQRITALIALFPTALGGTTSANSFPVVLSSDGPFAIQTGSITETAPATDTASSGLNGRLQRLAQRLTSLIALLPASIGGKTAAASLAVTLASDDVLIAPLGGVTETAPATDTASSGLNGRLQRIAQRLTSLIALVPASLGQKAMTASMAVVIASDQSAVPASIADSSHVTFGAKADAKSTATDTTSVSAMSVWKQISASVQAVATSVAATLTVKQVRSSTGTQSNVAGSASSVTILASNANRLGGAVYNDSTAILYLLLGSGTASATAHSVQMQAGSYFEVPAFYTGAMTGIWASATGSARVTELT